jgi:hypothetical protein
MKTSLRNLCLAVFFSLSYANAQVQVIPQVADGGGWATTIVLTNTTATAQTAVLKFNQSIGTSGGTQAWTPPFMESVTLSAISLPAGATLFLHTPGTASVLSQGWGELDAVAGVAGYAIFTSHAPGNPAQDATAPAVTAATRILVPFDNSSGLITAVAVVNPNATPETILVNIKTSDGAVSNGTLPSQPAKGQKTFLMPTAYPETAGKSGLAEFYTNSGTISIIALRANPSGAFTSAPVYSESGPPILGGTSHPVGANFSKMVASTSLAASQRLIIPQVADGDGWRSTIVLINTSASAELVTLKFNQRIGTAGATMLWNPPFNESVSLTNLSLPGGTALFLHTPGSAATLTQGWGELDADPAVVGYAIFTSAAPGNPAQDATAPAGLSATRILVPFDNTSGFIAAVAIANPNAAGETVSVNIRTSDGVTSTTTLPSLPANGQTTFLMPTQFPGTAGKSGLAEFFVNSGSFSIIALRANPSGAFTAAPVYFETGAPIISTGGGTTIGKIVQGSLALSKISFFLPSSSTPFESESMSGSFSAYTQAELNLQHGQIQIGACSISDFTYDLNQPPPNAADTQLDAGATIPVSGPNLASGSFLASIPGSTGPVYRKMLTVGTLSDGAYTLTGNGGTEIGPFTVSGAFPGSFAVTNFASITAINRATPLTVSWTGTGFSRVEILLSSANFTDTTSHNVSVLCLVPATPASFTVSADILSHLLPVANDSLSGFGLLEVVANSEAPFTAKIVKTGANIDSGFLELSRGYGINVPIN